MRETAAEKLIAMDPFDAKRWIALVESSGLPDGYYLPENAYATAEIKRTEPVARMSDPSSRRMLAPVLLRHLSTTTNGSRMQRLNAATPYGYGSFLRLSPSDPVHTAAFPCFFEQLHDWCSERGVVCCVIRQIDCRDWDEQLNLPKHMNHGRRADMPLADRALHVTWTSEEDHDADASLNIFCSLYDKLFSLQSSAIEPNDGATK
jgi:hypothetical protein